MAKYNYKIMMTKCSRATEMATLHSYGVDGIETDIRVTSDGIYVMRHETYVADDSGNRHEIKDTNYATLKSMDAELLTLAESIAITDAYGFRVIYDMKISDIGHIDNIYDIFVGTNANFRKIYIEPMSSNYIPLWIEKDKRINIAVGDMTLIDLVGTYLTGLNHGLLIGSVAESTDDVWTDTFKSKLKKYNIETVCANILNTNTNVDKAGAYPYDIYWTPYIKHIQTIMQRLDTMKDEKEERNLPEYLGNIADAIREAYGVDCSVNALEFANAIRYISN